MERQPATSWEPGGPGSAQDLRCGHRLPEAIGKPSFPFAPLCSSHCSFESGFSCDSKKENIYCPTEALNCWTTSSVTHALSSVPETPLFAEAPHPSPAPFPCKFCSLSSWRINLQPLRARIRLVLPGIGFPWQPKALLCHL